jgi:hypothetical protein
MQTRFHRCSPPYAFPVILPMLSILWPYQNYLNSLFSIIYNELATPVISWVLDAEISWRLLLDISPCP